MNEILIAIPTKNRSDILPLPLYSLFQQSYEHFDVLIYDQSDEPCTSNYIVRQMIDLLQIHKGIEIKHIRDMKNRSLALARHYLLNYAYCQKYKYLLMLDDDVILTPDCLSKLYNEIKTNKDIIFVSGVAIDVNNALGHSDYSVDIKSSFDGLSDWAIPHYYYSNKLRKNIRTVTGGFHYLIDVSKIDFEMLDKLTTQLAKLHQLPCEDIMLEYHLTSGKYKGRLITDAVVYHCPSTAQPRDWYNVTRKLQERISKSGEL